MFLALQFLVCFLLLHMIIYFFILDMQFLSEATECEICKRSLCLDYLYVLYEPSIAYCKPCYKQHQCVSDAFDLILQLCLPHISF